MKECPFRYQGQYEDGETGLYYNRFRYYDSNAGTYLSQDPIKLASGYLNLYAYVLDSNICTDILGLTQSARTKQLPEALQRRPKWRKSTLEDLEMSESKRMVDGKYIDQKTLEPIEGDKVIGHKNQSWREYQEAHMNDDPPITRKKVIDDYNEIDNLGYEDAKSSSSDGGRLKGHEH